MRRALLVLWMAACGGSETAGPDAAGGDAAADDPDAGCAGAPARRTVDVGDVELSVAVQGCGPPVVLLHGFPEPAVSWAGVMAALAGDFTVIAPDQRGYDYSEVPAAVADYEVATLVADLEGLLDATVTQPVLLVAHDWGGIVAWTFAAEHPERLRGLVIMNSPHPDVFRALLADDPEQQQASGYMNLFVSDGAEDFLSANDYGLLISAFGGALTAEQEARYREAWARSGLTGMLSWYRANVDSGPVPRDSFPSEVRVAVPTLVLWGMMDTALLPQNLDGLDAWVDDLEVQELPDASHWLVHEEEDAVVAALRGFAAAH